MKCIPTPPVASTLLESMRAIGYSFEAALADLIDNSLSAGARNVDLYFPPSGEPYVAIVDDGRGMSRLDLMEAMRHGSRSPLAPRSRDDLGRFGLGLKTASLSQARRLTVVSKRDGHVCGAEWNLDEVARRGDWALLELEQADLDTVPLIQTLHSRAAGTLVIWRDLDRALAGESALLRALQDHMDRTRAHVALVFHRFIEAQPAPVMITSHQLRGHFDRVEVVEGKTAALFRRLIAEMHVPPSECWIIGDSVRSDINPGIEAGANCILYLYTHHSYYWRQEYGDAPRGSFYLARTLLEALEILRNPHVAARISRVPERDPDLPT